MLFVSEMRSLASCHVGALWTSIDIILSLLSMIEGRGHNVSLLALKRMQELDTWETWRDHCRHKNQICRDQIFIIMFVFLMQFQSTTL